MNLLDGIQIACTESFEMYKHQGGELYYTRFSQLLTRSVLFEASDLRMADPDFDRMMFNINDLLTADTSMLSPDDVRAFAGRVREVLLEQPHVVVIVIASTDLSYGLSRIWLGSTKPVSENVFVVSSVDDALEIVDRIHKERRDAHSSQSLPKSP